MGHIIFLKDSLKVTSSKRDKKNSEILFSPKINMHNGSSAIMYSSSLIAKCCYTFFVKKSVN